MNGISPQLQALEHEVPNRLEWKYEMRREAQEILPGLYLGPFQPSFNLLTLQGLGITHILCIAEEREQHLFRAKFPEQFVYKILCIRDSDDQNLIRIFPDSHAFIDDALGGGGRVLVHCGDGISRSPAVMTAYVMCKTGLPHEDAFTFVQNRRFCVAPRIEFQHQIEAYRPIFQARQTTASDLGAQAGQRARRRGRDDEDGDDTSMIANGDMNMDRPVDADMMQRRPVPDWSGIQA